MHELEKVCKKDAAIIVVCDSKFERMGFNDPHIAFNIFKAGMRTLGSFYVYFGTQAKMDISKNMYNVLLW